MSELDELITYALSSGQVTVSPEVQAEVDRLLSKDAPPLTVPQRQRFIAAAQRALSDRRAEINRAKLAAVCRCSHQRIEHASKGCRATVDWRAGMTTECPCRGFAEPATRPDGR